MEGSSLNNGNKMNVDQKEGNNEVLNKEYEGVVIDDKKSKNEPKRPEDFIKEIEGIKESGVLNSKFEENVNDFKKYLLKVHETELIPNLLKLDEISDRCSKVDEKERPAFFKKILEEEGIDNGERYKIADKIMNYFKSISLDEYSKVFIKTDVGESICKQEYPEMSDLRLKEHYSDNVVGGVYTSGIKKNEHFFDLMAYIYNDIEENKELKSFVNNTNRYRLISQELSSLYTAVAHEDVNRLSDVIEKIKSI